MNKNVRKNFNKVVGVVVLATASCVANASVDAGDAVTVIATGLVAVGAMGAAYLGVTVLKKVWAKIGG